MLNTPKKKIVVIGCGNVAWHIAKRIYSFKKFDLFIYNHKPNPNLTEFNTELHAQVATNLKNVISDADAYFICVSDSAIPSVFTSIAYLPVTSNILITSGSIDLKKIKSKFKTQSVLYPLQTFSKDDKIKWEDLILVIDPINKNSQQKALQFASLFTKQLIELNSEQRLKLHLAAVLVNNFTNSLFVEADNLVHTIRQDLDYRILLPLIKQTSKKLKHIAPKDAQTGPAKRHDKVVIQNHLALLKNNAKLKALYTLFTDLIEQQKK